MAVRLLPHAGAISEFQGHTGDCGQTAELCCLHCISGVALDAAHLNAIVADDVAHGEAATNGAEPLASIRDDLTRHGVQTMSYGYAEPWLSEDTWLPLLREWAGVKPIILEFAQAGKLPGHTDPGLRYHFIAILGVQEAGYLCADGDHPAAARGQLVNYARWDLAAAVPCGMLICEPSAVVTPPPAPTPVAVPAVAPLAASEIAELRSLLAALKGVVQGGSHG